jgi:uncharacterized membrane protein
MMMPLIKKLQEKTVLSLTDAVTVTQSFDGSAQVQMFMLSSSITAIPS